MKWLVSVYLYLYQMYRLSTCRINQANMNSCRITESLGPTETSIAPRQRPKAASSGVLQLPNSVTPVKMTVPSGTVSNGQKGKWLFLVYTLFICLSSDILAKLFYIQLHCSLLVYFICDHLKLVCAWVWMCICKCFCIFISPREWTAGSCADAEQQSAEQSFAAAAARRPETAATPSTAAATSTT